MAYNGTIAGTITFSAGKFGNAASGFSTSNSITLPDISSAVGSNFSIVIWVKTPTPASIQVFFSWGNPNVTWLAVGGNGNLVLGTDQADTGLLIGDNAWHQVIIYYNGSVQTAYVDGVAAGSTHNGTLPTGQMGAGSFIGGNYAFAGQVDQTAFFTGNRKTAESSVPTAAYTGSEPNIVALYPFNSDASDTASPPAPPTPVAAARRSSLFY